MKINRQLAAPIITTVFAVAIFAAGAFRLDMQSHLMYGGLSSLVLLTVLFGKFNSKFKLGKEEIFLLIFYTFFAISLITSSHPYGFTEFTTFSMGTLLYFLASNLSLDSFHKKTALWIILLVISVFSIYGLFDFAVSPEDRLSGLFQGDFSYSSFPNAMGDLLLIGLPLNWYMLRQFKFHEQRYAHVLTVLLLILNLTAFTLTFSRGSYLSLAAILGLGLGMHLVKEKNFKKIFTNSITALTVIVLGVILALSMNHFKDQSLQFEERVLNQDVSSVQSTNERLQFFKGALEITKDYPLTGFGPGGFEYAYPKYQENLLVLSNHPHNLILKISSESGIIAGLSFLIFLAILAIKAIYEYIWVKRKQQFSFATLMLITFGLTVHNLIDYNLNFTIISLVFFASLGLMSNPYLWQEVRIAEKHKDLIKNKSIIKVLLATLASVVLVLSLLQGYGHWNQKQAQYRYDDGFTTDLGKQLNAALISPFKQNLYELTSEININGDQNYLNQNIQDATSKYQDFYPLQYYQLQASPSREQAEKLLSLNGYNDLKFHLAYLQTLDSSELIEQSDTYISLLNEYTQHLAVNSHNTIATMNPKSADEIYQFYIKFLSDVKPEAYKLWTASYTRFQDVWSLELAKFNERYDTSLNTSTFDETFDSHF